MSALGIGRQTNGWEVEITPDSKEALQPRKRTKKRNTPENTSSNVKKLNFS